MYRPTASCPTHFALCHFIIGSIDTNNNNHREIRSPDIRAPNQLFYNPEIIAIDYSLSKIINNSI